MKNYFTISKTFLKSNWIILIIVCVATWLRVWQLDSHGILFSDAGRDLLVAHEAVENKTVPLLGIPSSVPRFKQGPVSIWIEMLVISMFGANTMALSLTFALLSVIAVIGIYEFVCIYIGKKQAYVAAGLLAVSPLAVANARVPYHTTALPLALVLYLFSLQLLSENKKYACFLVALGFAFLFQFELAMAPLFLLIPFVLWRKKIKLQKNNLIQLVTGLVVGLLPQIIFDVTHKFAQIGIFLVWIGHKLYEFVSFKDGGSVHFENYFSSFSTFGGRIFSTDHMVISLILLILTLYGFIAAFKVFQKKKLPSSIVITELSLLLLLVGYFIHGSPSEAYFPPFFILLPIHIAYTVFTLSMKVQKIILSGLVLLFFFNIVSIVRHNFFVNNPQHFSYGASTGEIRKVLTFIQTKSNNSYDLHTLTDIENRFPSYFDNYRWLALEKGYSLPSNNSQKFYIENTKTAPNSTPYLFRDFEISRVYWTPSQL